MRCALREAPRRERQRLENLASRPAASSGGARAERRAIEQRAVVEDERFVDVCEEAPVHVKRVHLDERPHGRRPRRVRQIRETRVPVSRILRERCVPRVALRERRVRQQSVGVDAPLDASRRLARAARVRDGGGDACLGVCQPRGARRRGGGARAHALALDLGVPSLHDARRRRGGVVVRQGVRVFGGERSAAAGDAPAPVRVVEREVRFGDQRGDQRHRGDADDGLARRVADRGRGAHQRRLARGSPRGGGGGGGGVHGQIHRRESSALRPLEVSRDVLKRPREAVRQVSTGESVGGRGGGRDGGAPSADVGTGDAEPFRRRRRRRRRVRGGGVQPFRRRRREGCDGACEVRLGDVRRDLFLEVGDLAHERLEIFGGVRARGVQRLALGVHGVGGGGHRDGESGPPSVGVAARRRRERARAAHASRVVSGGFPRGIGFPRRRVVILEHRERGRFESSRYARRRVRQSEPRRVGGGGDGVGGGVGGVGGGVDGARDVGHDLRAQIRESQRGRRGRVDAG